DELIEILPPTREAGEQLVEAGDFDKLIFTGSTRTGRAIARVLADRLIPSSLELSGCDSAIVLADANPELAARVIVNAVRMNRGQTCMAPRRVIVDAAVRAEFVESLKRAVNSESESSDPAAGVVTPGEAGRVRSMIESHKTAGCEVLIDDTIAVLLDVEGDSELARGEWFAPLLTIISARNEEEAIAIHRQHEQHLTTSVFTTTPDRAKRIAVALTSSNITINDCILPIAHPGVGIAGRGPSGWGITQGESGLLSMTHEVVVSKTPGRFRIPPEPPSEEQVSMLRRGMRYIYGNRSGRAGLTSVTRSNGNGSE
ncbi:MAG: aldehyde dehydrogenase family protein, partial [Planctomycetota bacterium]